MSENLKIEIKNFIENDLEDGALEWKSNVDKFKKLLFQDLEGHNNSVSIDEILELDVLKSIEFEADELDKLKYFLPKIISNIKEKKESIEKNKIILYELEGYLKNINNDNFEYHKKNTTESLIKEYYFTKKTDNSILTAYLLPLKYSKIKTFKTESKINFRENIYEIQNQINKLGINTKRDFSKKINLEKTLILKDKKNIIQFDKIKDSRGIISGLQKLFSFYSEPEKQLNLITSFYSILQSQVKGIPYKELKLGLINFLKNNKKLEKYLKTPKNLQKEKNELIKNPDYWRIRNLLQLFGLAEKKQKKVNGRELIIGTFSPGGSYGGIYLGKLHSQYMEQLKTKKQVLPDIYIGGSAGALYPTIFILWKKALEKNPQGLAKAIGLNHNDKNFSEKLNSLDSLLNFIPDNLDYSDFVVTDGYEIVSKYLEKVEILVKLSQGENTDVSKITFNDYDSPLLAVGSFDTEDGFVPILFGGDDPSRDAIFVSANKRLGTKKYNINALLRDETTLKDKSILGEYTPNGFSNTMYGLKIYDGVHTVSNPLEFAYLLNGRIERYESFDTQENDDTKGLVKKDHFPLDGLNQNSSLLGKGTISQGYGFNRENIELLSILGKRDKLEIYNLSDIISEIEKKYTGDRKKELIEETIDYFLDKEEYKINDVENNKNKVKILNLLNNILTEEQKEIFLENLFEKEINFLKKIKKENLKNNSFKKMLSEEIKLINNKLDFFIVNFRGNKIIEEYVELIKKNYFFKK